MADSDRTGLGPLEYAASGAAGLGAAAFSGIDAIRNEFYEVIKHTPAIKAIVENKAHIMERLSNNLVHPETGEEAGRIIPKGNAEGVVRQLNFEETMRAIEENTLNDSVRLPAMTTEQLALAQQAQHRVSEATYNAAIAKMGYREGYVGGTKDRFLRMSVSKRAHVLGRTSIGAIIGIAGTSMFFGALHMRKNIKALMDRLDQRDAEQHPGRS